MRAFFSDNPLSTRQDAIIMRKSAKGMTTRRPLFLFIVTGHGAADRRQDAADDHSDPALGPVVGDQAPDEHDADGKDRDDCGQFLVIHYVVLLYLCNCSLIFIMHKNRPRRQPPEENYGSLCLQWLRFYPRTPKPWMTCREQRTTLFVPLCRMEQFYRENKPGEPKAVPAFR